MENKNKKLLVGLILLNILILLSTSVFATSFSTRLTQIQPRILPGEIAKYNLTINNADATSQIYTIGLVAADASNWIITPNSLKVNAESTNKVSLKILPKSSTALGSYILNVQIKDFDGTKKNVAVPLILSLDSYTVGYKEDVALNVDMPVEQDSRNKLRITVLLRNRNPLDLKNLTIEISSDLFTKNYLVNLGPRKEKTQDFVFTLDPLQKPGEYPVSLKIISSKGKLLEIANKILSIKEYSKVSLKSKTSSKWFSSTETIILTNNGNHERTKDIAIQVPWYKRIFTSSNPEGVYEKIDGVSQIKFVVDLKATETKQIVITRNYRSLVVLLIVLIVLLILYYLLRSPILILKEAAVVKEDSEGVSEIKIRIFLKNRSRKKIHSTTIVDKLPSITQMSESKHAFGSLKPTKISKTSKKGIILYWDIDNLDAYEERIITYTIKSKLKIIGRMTLPSVLLKFNSGDGKEKRIRSKPPMFVKN